MDPAVIAQELDQLRVKFSATSLTLVAKDARIQELEARLSSVVSSLGAIQNKFRVVGGEEAAKSLEALRRQVAEGQRRETELEARRLHAESALAATRKVALEFERRCGLLEATASQMQRARDEAMALARASQAAVDKHDAERTTAVRLVVERDASLKILKRELELAKAGIVADPSPVCKSQP